MRKQIYSLCNSFKYAYSGLIYSLRTQRNMRIHFVVSFFVMWFSALLHISRADTVLLLLMIGCVICAEFINTAIETIIDKITPWYNESAKVAKDAAAAGVLVFAIIAVIGGLLVFMHKALLESLIQIAQKHPIELVPGIIIVLVGSVYIFTPGKMKNLGGKDDRFGSE